MTALAVVRNIDSPRALRTTEDAEDFEQEIVDQYALAMAAAGLSDGHVAHTRSVIVEFARSLDGPLWSASCEDADRFLAGQRRAGHTVSTRAGKAGVLALFYEFVIGRYQGDIHALCGVVVEQPIDEFNRQQGASLGKVRVPPSDAEVEELFAGWRASCAAGAQVPAGRAGLLRRVAVAPAGAADQRDGDARHPRLAPGPRRARQAARPPREGQPRTRPEGPARAGDQRRRHVDRLVAGRGPTPVRR